MNKDAPPVQHQRTHVCENPLALGLGLVLLSTLASCSKQSTLPSNELFRRIQEHEARIDAGNEAVRAAVTCRQAHAPAETHVCDESQALCALTLESKDVDANRRCVMASDSCRAARERARALCATPASP